MSNKKFKPYTENKSLSPKLVWYNYKIKFKGGCLKQEDQAAFTPKNVVKFFIVYELDLPLRDLNAELNLGGFVFGGVKLTENDDPDKYSYSGFGIEFDTPGQYSLKMLLFLELIWAHLCILIIKEKIS